MNISVNIPDRILISLKEKPEDIWGEISMAAAAKLYELGKLSSGAAAEMAGLSRICFLQKLSNYKVPIFDMTEEEIEKDVLNASPDNQ